MNRPLRQLLLALPTTLAVAIAADSSARAQTDYVDQSLGYQLGRDVALRSTHRPVSLDVAGNLTDSRWSAVWEPNPTGIDWDAAYGMSFDAFIQWRNERMAQDYRLHTITAAGSGAEAVFGAIMLRDGRASIQWVGIDPADLQADFEAAHGLGLSPICFTSWGTADQPKFAMVFEDNPDNDRHGVSLRRDPSEHQDVFDAFTQNCWAKPLFVTRSPWGKYTSFYTDREYGQWYARHGLTRAQYDADRALQLANGWLPMQLDVSGSGANKRFSFIFRRGAPAQRIFNTRGQFIPELQEIDDYYTQNAGEFMREKNTRQAAVAIVREGRLVFARAYTYAPATHPIAEPSERFRLGSVSKPISAIGVMHFLEQNAATIQMDSRLVDLLPIGTPIDSRVNDITIRHLLNHTSGYDASWHHVTNRLAHIVDTFANRDLAFTPGTDELYGDGLQVLAGIIEHHSGMSFTQYMRQNVMDPMQVFDAHWLRATPGSGDVRFHESNWGGSRRLRVVRSPLLPGNPWVNAAHDLTFQQLDATGGMVASPIETARLISGVFDRSVHTGVLSPIARVVLETEIERPGRTGGFDGTSNRYVDALGRTVKRYTKGGLWNSARCNLFRRADGITIVTCSTGPSAPPSAFLENFLDQMSPSDWPDTDLFPAFDLDSLPRADETTSGDTMPFGFSCALDLDHFGLIDPEIGTSYEFGLVGGPSNTAAFCYLGFSNTTIGGTVPLPVDLEFLGAPGCSLYVSPDLVIGSSTDGAGDATLSLAVPDDPSLVGTQFFTQFVVPSDATALGLAYSNGLHAIVGG